MEKMIYIGILVLFIGILLIFIGSLYTAIKGESKANVKSAGIVFIGPFPLFGWATSKKMFYILIALAIVMFIFWFILRKI